MGKVVCGGGAKTVKEVWKAVGEGSVALRVAREGYYSLEGGKDKGVSVEGFEERLRGKWRLSSLEVESRRFRVRREQARRGDSSAVATDGEIEEEKQRRREMAHLRKELYGGGVGKEGRLAMDPEWDDVEPVVLEEPEGALAAIQYSSDYAEGELLCVS